MLKTKYYYYYDYSEKSLGVCCENRKCEIEKIV